MSGFAMVDTYDTQMVDFTDDVDVSMAVSSSDSWFHAGAHMEEDGLAHQQPTIIQHDPLEIDMTHYEETEEYEMADEQLHVDDHEPVDAEVYDASIHTSPALFPAVHPPHVPAVISIAATSSYSSDHEPIIPVQGESSNLPSIFRPSESPEQLITFNLSENESNTTLTTAPTSIQHPIVNQEVHPQELENPGETTKVLSYTGEINEEEDGGNDYHEVPSVHESSPEAETHEKLIAKSLNEEISQRSEEDHPDGNGFANETEGVIQQAEIIQHNEAQADDDEQEKHGESSATDLEPPPPVLLSLHMTASEGDQPDFVLFNLPDVASSSHEELAPHGEEPLVLLQHQPSLFYEPISAVFEAFRREEYFTHLEELSEAEMVLNAFELQLIISEDNIYAREVSIHDLYAMHHGVGLPGHLRLYLQSIHPRFITRYNLLREQITTRLSSAGVVNESEVKEDHQDHNNEFENGYNDEQQDHESELHPNETVHEEERQNGKEESPVLQEVHTEENDALGNREGQGNEDTYDVTDDDAEGEIDSTHEDADQENDGEGQTVSVHNSHNASAIDTVDENDRNEDDSQENPSRALDADTVHIVNEHDQILEEQGDEVADSSEFVESALPNHDDQNFEDETNEEGNDLGLHEEAVEPIDGHEDEQAVSSSSAFHAVTLTQSNSHSTSSYSTDEAWEGDDLQVVHEGIENGEFVQEDEFGELDEFEEDVTDETIDDHLALENANADDPDDPEKTFSDLVGDHSQSEEKKHNTISKNSSKRSIDDLQDIGDEDDLTLGSPGSKRNRVS